MLKQIVSLAIVGMIVVSCGTTAGESPSAQAKTETTLDGLVRVDTDADGDLFLRMDHGIGGYDAILVAPSFVHYRRSSTRLDSDIEDVYLASLEQSLVDVAEEAHVPIVYQPHRCVIKVGIGFINVALARRPSAKILGEVTLVIEYRDSMSNQSLLRFVAPKRIERETGDTTRKQQIRNSFDKMIAEVDIIAALRAATVVPSPPRPGCNGDLLRAGIPDMADGTSP